MTHRAVRYDIRRVTAASRIDAPASCVWPLLVQADRLPAWNPLVIQAIGEVEEQAYLVLWFRLPGGATKYTRLRFSKVDRGREIVWSALPRRDALIGYEHRIRLDPLGRDRVRVLQEALFFGRLPAGFWTGVASRFKQGLTAMNASLRAEAETLATAQRDRVDRIRSQGAGLAPATARPVSPVSRPMM